jgi:Concanavalin A-like lectin/glucanases superfamily
MPTAIVTHQYEFPSENPITTFGAGWTLVGSVTRPLFFGVGSSLDDVITQFNGWQDVGTAAPLTKRIVLHQIEYTRLYGTDVVTITYPMISSAADPVISVKGTITATEQVAFTNGTIGAEWVVTNRVHHAVVTLVATTSRKSRTSTNPRFLCGLEAIDYVRTPRPLNAPLPPPPPPPSLTAPGAPRYIFAELLTQIPTGGDPYFQNVSLLLHCEGTNTSYGNSTPIIDSSPRVKSVTVPNGIANYTNSEPKFGSSAIYIDNDITRQMTIPAATTDLQFGSGDFTIEAWVYPITLIGPVILFETQSDLQSLSGGGVTFRFGPGANIDVYTDNTNRNWGVTGPNPQYGWNHIAMVRSGSTLISFLNGIVVSTGSVNGSVNIGSSTYPNAMFRVDGSGQAMLFDGFIDDVRITKGIARYTANFTVPTTQFPDN